MFKRLPPTFPTNERQESRSLPPGVQFLQDVSGYRVTVVGVLPRDGALIPFVTLLDRAMTAEALAFVDSHKGLHPTM
jgi:hypothetical protein